MTRAHELLEKYDAMASLRRSETEPSRERLRALAARFPGVLRELDEMPLDVIDARREALAQAARGCAPEEPWMTATLRFHDLMRGALAAKKWLGDAKRSDETTETDFARDHRDPAALAWAPHLASLAKPRNGRIVPLVFARLSRELGCSEVDARALVLPFARPARP